MILEDSGERRVALLVDGLASRLTAAGLGKGVVVEVVLLAGSPKSFALLGVGVAGGAGVFAVVRRLLGVDGASISAVSVVGSGAAFLFLDLTIGAGGGGITADNSLLSAVALKRADLRVDIVTLDTCVMPNADGLVR